ncbi:MAG: hypothetical protein D6759_01355 [Chloroflexi bacterium]|nr:MAG: hypothetical protein D6759_01355 [Chloroflexota bacterium]
MRGKSKYLFITLAVGLGLTLALLGLVGYAQPAHADPGVLYVAPDGDDANHCASITNRCRTIQRAVDVARPGDEIRVAAGVYAGVSARAGITQTVYISKTVTVRGGYTTTNWTTPDPAAHPTTLDAQGQGRVVYISGNISPTLEGLRITGGDAAGLGGAPGGKDAGGGVYIYQATAIISNCMVYSNTASTADWGYGGGLFLYGSGATLSGNTVVSNTASTASYGHGGGLFLYGSGATLNNNTVQGNTASTAGWGYGGGLYLLTSDAALSGNTVVSNVAGTAYRGWGGGLYIWYSDATLSGNTVQGNTASTVDQGYGGGLSLSNSDATLSGNTIVSNTATLNPFSIGKGGGLYVWESGSFALTNNLVADNHAYTAGSGLWFKGTSTRATSGRLLHTTIADNDGSGQGVYADEYTTLTFTNTIIAGHHSVGISVTTGSTATLEATLWYNNGSDTGGGGNIMTGTVNVYGDPAFVNPSAWDYHLTASSAAIDRGVDAGVTTDLDNNIRPIGQPDLGAYEWSMQVYLPVLFRNYGP